MRNLLAASLILSALAGAARAENIYGVMLWPRPGEETPLLLARARGLGVAWYRPPTVYVDRWQGPASCAACAEFARSGLRLALSVREAGEGGREPSYPPADIAAYKTALGSILEAWKPDLVAIESEEDSPRSYSASGDAAGNYAKELAAACEVAHARHVQCTNGGLSWQAAAALAWEGFLQAGHADEACDFAERALPGRALCAFRAVADVPAELKASLLADADKFLAVYKAGPIDAVNFHWYGIDARAFAQVADYLARATGKPVLSNEIGQRRNAVVPDAVRPLLRAALATGMRLAIWYSIDTADTASLFEPDGRLRLSGWEFQRQLSGLR